MIRLRLWLLSSLVVILTIPFSSLSAQTATPIQASTPLGSVTTATLWLDPSDGVTTSAQLFEGRVPGLQAREAAPAAPLRVSLPDVDGPVARNLLAEFAAAPDGMADMMIYLADQADLSAAAAIEDWNQRGAAVVQTLQDHAARSQAPLLAELQKAGYTPRRFWIVNAVQVRGPETLARWAATQPGVGVVAANQRYQLDATTTTTAAFDARAVAWGVDRINASTVWDDWGVRGTGIVVANIDTGVAFRHPALSESYRGWVRKTITHDYNWYDGAGSSAEPVDLVGHGTHTMGTIAGRATLQTGPIGVAPATRWITARGCYTLYCADGDLMLSAEWMLAPRDRQGRNPRPDLRPHIISNSWTGSSGDAWYLGYVTAWNAAGIFSVFAAGNSGPSCRSTGTPAEYVEAFSVGAVYDDDIAAFFSARGPAPDGRVKPNVTAPGVFIPSAVPNGGLELMSGTSMATPHVAGVAALLWSANPDLIGDVQTTKGVLTRTAFPRSTSECTSETRHVPNNVYGWGIVDAREAVQAARVDVPWLSLPASVTLATSGQQAVPVTLDARQVAGPGQYFAQILVRRNNTITAVPVTFTVTPTNDASQVRGRLIDRWTNAGVYGEVRIADGPAITTSETGEYSLILRAGDYGYTTNATGYVAASATLRVPASGTQTLLVTPDTPHLQVAAEPLTAVLGFGTAAAFPVTVSNSGPRVLTMTVTIPPLEWSVEDSFGGGPSTALYDMRAFPPLAVDDDMIYTDTLELGFTVPMYGTQVSKLYLSTNGWVSMTKPQSAASGAECLPHTNVPPGTLAPFWTDLDPSEGGAVRAGRVAPDTYVVSWEQVPHWSENPSAAAPTYTFQLILRADGRVQYRYAPMTELPDNWSIGVGYEPGRGQSIACRNLTQVLDDRTWTLQNQPQPAFWLTATPATLRLQPNTSALINARFLASVAAPWRDRPYVAAVRLVTNDPLNPSYDLPATLTVGWPNNPLYLPFLR